MGGLETFIKSILKFLIFLSLGWILLLAGLFSRDPAPAMVVTTKDGATIHAKKITGMGSIYVRTPTGEINIKNNLSDIRKLEILGVKEDQSSYFKSQEVILSVQFVSDKVVEGIAESFPTQFIAESEEVGRIAIQTKNICSIKKDE